MLNLEIVKKTAKKSLARAFARIEEQKVQANIQGKLLEHLQEAAEAVVNDSNELEETIYQELKKLEAAGKYTKNEEITREMAKQLCAELAMHCKNWVHVTRGRPTAVSYIPSALGAAMNIHLRSPAAARQLREDSCLPQPCTRYMQSIKSRQEVTDGFCPAACIIQPTYREMVEDQKYGEWGQIGMDEVKLTGGVVMSSTTNEITGISSDFFDISKIVKNLLDEDEIEKMNTPTVYALQLSYRATTGRVFNIMHFFSNGALSANKMLDYIFKCIMCCELVGSKVFGLISDAAGAMQRVFKYLRGKEELPEGAWLPIDLVRFVNPFDPSRYIYLFHCGTHNLKNMRGQLCQSYAGGPKILFMPMVTILGSKSLSELGFVTRGVPTRMYYARPVSIKLQSSSTSGIK